MSGKNIRRDDWETLEPTIFGWGIKDVNYIVRNVVDVGKVGSKRVRKVTWVCPYFQDWKNMIMRCFCSVYQKTCPTYKGCTISEDWKYLSKFIEWVDSQPNRDWQNCIPDKDLLAEGNKHYSPDTVVYVPPSLNAFILSCNKSRGQCMLGVTYTPKASKKSPYKASCSNPFINKGGNIGRFPTELEAHKAWQAKKHEYACRLADLQDDPRVAEALRQRYAPDKDWTKG